MKSVIYWISVEDKLPELDTVVLTVNKYGFVECGQYSSVNAFKQDEHGRWRRTNEKILEWGIEGEMWIPLEDIVYWADMPEFPDERSNG